MMFKAFVLLFLLPASLDAMGTQVAGYDNKRMLAIIRNFNGSLSEQLDLIHITWGKLRADYPRDTAKMEDLSETLDQVMCQSEGNASLQQNMRGYLIREQIAEYMEVMNTSDLFRMALAAPEHDMGKWQLRLATHFQRLLCLYSSRQQVKIIEKVIRNPLVYANQLALPLAILLRQLYVPNNRESYELLLRSELLLYQRYKDNAGHQQQQQQLQQQNLFGTYMAKLWQEMQEDNFYAGLDYDTKRELLDAVIELLHYL